MKPHTLQTRSFRFFMCLLFILDGGLVDSSSLSSLPPRSVSCEVGHEVVLPCSWKSRLGEVELPSCHVRWDNWAETVFEQLGEQRFEAEGFEGRMQVPEEKLGSGDCSLIIKDVQIMDTGRYESFMVVDGVRETKTRVFIQSVELSVSDHDAHETRAPGQDLVLDLFTSHSMRVVFQGRNSSSWSELWMRGEDRGEDSDGRRLLKLQGKEKVMMKVKGQEDEGTFKVVDEHGLTVSTVKLTVQESSSSFPEKHQRRKDDGSLKGGVSKNSVSFLLLSSLLVFILQTFHLS